ncbi:transposase [Patescibacteria group bacterium]|nr:transposase [Patescibacteria group bacterium]MBU2633201.1 transposase [Patescibacteria group bacterium]
MKKPIFVNNKIYHIYNRGVEKRKIFMNDKDYFRFIHDLFEFNDEALSSNMNFYFNPETMKVESQYLDQLKEKKKPRKLLVEILIFTLMPNHFHLLLMQKKEGGIVKFMQKLGTGYTNYFNKKYERVGSLFQGRFKAVKIEEHAHILHLPYYIHLNPLKLINYGSSTSIVRQMKFLENYRWSSFPDYVKKKNFPSVTQREFLLDFFGGEEKYKKETKDWLKDSQRNLENMKDIILE